MNSKLLSFFLFISFLNFAYPDTDQVKNLKISLQRSGFDNSNEILVAFKACFNVKETDRLYRDLLKSSFNINNKQLLKIQYAKTLNSFGSQIESVKIMDEVSRSLDKSSTIVKVEYYIVLGGISVNSESPVLAREYFQKALALLEGKNNNVSRMKCYTSLGMTFTAENKLDSAIVYFNKAGAIDHGESGLNSLYLKLNMAWMSSKLGEFESSKANFLEAIDLFTVVPDVFAELRTYGNLGDIYFEQDSIALAKMYYEKGLKMANKFGFKLDVFRFERSLGLSFAKESNYREAFYYLNHSDSIREAFDHEKITNETQRIEKDFMYKIEKERRESSKRIIKETKRANALLTIAIVLITGFAIFIIIYFIQIKNKNRILLQQLLDKDRKKEKVDSNAKVDQLAKQLVVELENLIFTKELYKNENLTLEKLAKKLKTNRTYLSECINSNYNTSFSRWLNEIRINESRKLLRAVKNDKYSIEGIANMVGFSSISAFNSNFKSITGLTPSYYRKNHIKH